MARLYRLVRLEWIYNFVSDSRGPLGVRLLGTECWCMVFWSWLVGLWDVEHIVGLQPVVERTWLAKFWLSGALKARLRWPLRGSPWWLLFDNHLQRRGRVKWERFLDGSSNLSRLRSLLSNPLWRRNCRTCVGEERARISEIYFRYMSNINMCWQMNGSADFSFAFRRPWYTMDSRMGFPFGY